MEMDDVKRLLHAVHELDIQDLGRRLAEERKNCLSRPQALQLAVNPQAWTGEIHSHVAECWRCQYLLQNVGWALVHPSWSQIACWLANQVPEQEARMMENHVQKLGCQRCRTVAAAVMSELARRIVLGRLRNPRLAAADAGEPIRIIERWQVHLGSTRPRDVRVELIEEGEQLILRVRTDDPALYGHLLAFALRDEAGQEVQHGFLLPRRLDHGRLEAEVKFDLGELYRRASGPCEVLVFGMDAPGLSADDRQALEEAVNRDTVDEPGRALWRHWISTAAQKTGELPSEVRTLLDGLAHQLGQ
jgi:hypothetical protein